MRREIEGFKSDLRDSYIACSDESEDLYQCFTGMKDMAIETLAKVRRLIAKARESRKSVKIESSSKQWRTGQVASLPDGKWAPLHIS
ncbi:hypothetical protein AVEN_130255-1 [Araneus ventricosus]|uniref:Uncharacterized protein n=1 Tax=Araneus ventricosus TaxID=182803 RepID=A0A4Y2FLM5_ARAVE|nr:hypothetical protein AVEN_130255-1 [Araneus ventricosus]